MTGCKCNGTLGNTGLPSCISIPKVAKKAFYVPYYDSTGAINSVDMTGTIDQAYFTDKINEADASKRWYPLPEIKNVEETKEDSTFEDFNDGSKAFIRQGKRNFTGIMIGVNPTFLKQIDEFRCVNIGVYYVDIDGNLIGAKKVDDLLYPIEIDKETWDAKAISATDSTVYKIQLGYQYGLDERDGDLWMITPADMADDVRLLSLGGLLNIRAEFSSVTADGFVVELNTPFGHGVSIVRAEGVVIGEIAVYDNADDSSQSLAGATLVEGTGSSKGIYTLSGLTTDLDPGTYYIGLTKTGYSGDELYLDTFEVGS